PEVVLHHCVLAGGGIGDRGGSGLRHVLGQGWARRQGQQGKGNKNAKGTARGHGSEIWATCNRPATAAKCRCSGLPASDSKRAAAPWCDRPESLPKQP